MKYRGFNRFEIKEDHAIVFIQKRNGDIFEVKVDIEDIERLKNYGYAWQVVWDNNNQSYYARHSLAVQNENGTWSYKVIFMHRFLSDAKDNEYIDHKNFDTLDNRKLNFRYTENNLNLKNRKGKNSNNKSGYRNVSWISGENKWRVQLQINGKNTKLKDFSKDQVHEAGKFAKEMREKYYGEFAGNS
jgi:hypothetical protein